MSTLGVNDDETPGFRFMPDAGSARRQMNVSVLVVAMLAVAIMAALLSLDVRPVGPEAYRVSVPTMRQASEHMPADVSKS